jgi:hypothetical protein
VDSVTGKGQDFDGNTGYTGGHRQYIEIPDNDGYSIPTTNKLPVSFWFQPTVTDWYDTDGNVMDYINMLGKGQNGRQTEWVWTMGGQNSPNKPWEIACYAHSLSAGSGNGAGIYKSWTANSDKIFCVATFDTAANRIRGRFFYPDGTIGVDTNTFSGLTIAQGTAPIVIGGDWASSQDQYLKSRVDELEISNVVRDDAWTKATYYAQKDELLYYGDGGAAFQSRYEHFMNDIGSLSAGGAQWRGQSFTPAKTHILQLVKLKLLRIVNSGVGNFKVAIRATDGNGLPMGIDLSTGSILCNDIGTTTYAIYSIRMTDVVVNTSKKYAIIFSAPSMSPGDIGYRVNDINPNYAGGCSLHNANSGATWDNVTQGDIYFEEWGIPLQLHR